MPFSRNWFLRHQFWLVPFARSWFGRLFFCLDRPWRLPKGKLLIQMLPDSITWIDGLSKDGRLRFGTNFIACDWYALRLKWALKPFILTAHFLDWLVLDRFPKLGLSFGCATTNNFTVAYDGIVSRSVGYPYESYAQITGGNGTQVSSTAGQVNVALFAPAIHDKYHELARGMCAFYTGTTLAGKVVISGTVNVYADGRTEDLGTPSMHFTKCFPATPNDLVPADYENAFSDATLIADSITYADWSGGKQSPMNSAGMNYLNQTTGGYTSIGYRIDVDFSPSHSTDVAGVSYLLFDAIEAGGGTQPSITVVYENVEIFIGGGGGGGGGGGEIERMNVGGMGSMGIWEREMGSTGIRDHAFFQLKATGLTRWLPPIRRRLLPAWMLTVIKKK